MIIITLGESIRQIREQSNMSITQLSRISGITSSHISQIERDLTSPSVSVLRKISAALGVPVSVFFTNEEQERGEVVRHNKRKRLQLPDSHIVYEVLSPASSKNLQLLMTTLEAGVSSSEAPMSHGGEECALVTGGTVEFTIGDETYVLEDGDSISYEGSIPHKIRNIGETEVIIISAISPPGF